MNAHHSNETPRDDFSGGLVVRLSPLAAEDARSTARACNMSVDEAVECMVIEFGIEVREGQRLTTGERVGRWVR